MTKKEPTVWETLSKIDVGNHIEKKGGFSYLSWAWAWTTLKSYYPDASFTKHQNPRTLMPYFVDEQTGDAFVSVTVRAGGEVASELYPVLDGANKPIKNPNAFQVNVSLQRAMAKAIAYLGLGAYIYAGEDLPFVPKEAKEAEVEGEVRKGTQMIYDALKEFLPHKETVQDLEAFWKANTQAVATLKEADAKLYDQLIIEFKKRKKELEK